MKKFKALLCSIAAIVLIAGTSLTAFAATNDDLIQALKDAKAPATYIIKAENYLKNNTLTSEQINAIIADVSKLEDILKSENVTDPSKLTAASKSEALDIIKDSASTAGLSISITKNAAGNAVVTLADKSGNEVLTTTAKDYLMKKTGNSSSSMIIIGTLMIIASVGTFLFAKKVNA